VKIGVFAKTFPTIGALATLQAVRQAGFETAQFNMACLGLPSMPDSIAPADSASIADASKATGVAIAAVSGTYNMIHPDLAVRAKGLARLEVLCASAKAMGTDLVTLCTGTRDAADQWRWHPDNATPAAWRDLLEEMAKAVAIAERHDVDLGVEPELANVVSSAAKAREMLDALSTKRVRIVLDPANLFETAGEAERRTIIERAVDLLGPDIGMAHAKDRDAQGGFVAPGTGVIDFAHFIARLRGAGFDGALVGHGFSAEEAPDVARHLRAAIG
jgi:sugar phosphate isomerase/epimerase